MYRPNQDLHSAHARDTGQIEQLARFGDQGRLVGAVALDVQKDVNPGDIDIGKPGGQLGLEYPLLQGGLHLGTRNLQPGEPGLAHDAQVDSQRRK